MKVRLLLLTLTLFILRAVLLFSPIQPIAATAMAQNKNADSKSSSQTKDDKKRRKKQTRQEVELKASKGTSTGKGASDPNIKEDETPNDPNTKRRPPAAKGGNSKGASYDCEVQFDNRTDLNIKTYVNGRYRGTLGGYDDAYLYIFPGYITVYGRADFSDGSYLYWGPQSYTCSENQYIYFKMSN